MRYVRWFPPEGRVGERRIDYQQICILLCGCISPDCILLSLTGRASWGMLLSVILDNMMLLSLFSMRMVLISRLHVSQPYVMRDHMAARYSLSFMWRLRFGESNRLLNLPHLAFARLSLLSIS